MIIKAIEIRDVATFIPAIAIGTLPDNEGAAPKRSEREEVPL